MSEDPQHRYALSATSPEMHAHGVKGGLPALFVGVAMLCLLLLPSASSLSSVPETIPEPPTADELRLVEELATWVHGDAKNQFEIFEATALSDVVRHRRQSFELFRRYNRLERQRALVASKPYGDLIYQAAEDYRLDSLLLAAIVDAESSFDPDVVSTRGALGLMQLMPDTAAQYGARDPLDPRLNVRAGARYLRSLLDTYDGDLELALAAYNAGPGNVRRYGGVPPFRETTIYVEKVLSTYIDYHRSVWRDSEVGELLDRLESPEGRVLASVVTAEDGLG